MNEKEKQLERYKKTFESTSVGRLKEKLWNLSDEEIDNLLKDYEIPSPGEREKPGSYIQNTLRTKLVETRRRNDIVLIPIGSTENHGAHTVSGFDTLLVTRIAEAVRRKTKKMGRPIHIASPIEYGVHPPWHQGMFGTVMVSDDAFEQSIMHIMYGLWNDGFRKQILLNNHAQQNEIEKTPVPLPGAFPQIERHPSPSTWSGGVLHAIPTYDPASADPWQVDLRMADASRLDLRDSLDSLLYADFDSRTGWPAADRMPPEYDPLSILELGKDPGLGMRQLHARGITGRNVGIAIIDQTLLVDHQEYADRLQLYEETDDIRGGWLETQMHGPAVASIAVGRTVGVAPEADLYYIASAFCISGTHESIDFACLAESVHRVLEINAELPAERKIRVLSMSIGWAPGNQGYDVMQAAAEAARDSGLLVICSSVEEVHGFRFHGLGRTPFADPNDVEGYSPGLWWAEQFYAGQAAGGTLLVPMESRATASPSGPQDYAFYRSGGWSWSIPYIAGAYALAAQVRPDITPDLFWMTALGTGTTIDVLHDGRTFSLGPILNPEALIAALRALS